MRRSENLTARSMMNVSMNMFNSASGTATSGSGYGYFSNFGNAGFIWSHGCASEVHTSICGLNQLGSSRLAVLIATMSGVESGLT